jgi:hypothetical protein
MSDMNNKKKLQEGDIFYVQVNGKYIFGRILMDINDRVLKFEADHKYKFYGGCYLVEIYKGIYDDPQLIATDIIMPCELAFKDCFYSGQYKVEWVLYEHQPVDYRKLDFPEELETGDNGFLDFRKFDICLPTQTLYHDFFPSTLNQKYTGGMHFSYYSLVDDALHRQGRDDLMRAKTTYFLSDTSLIYQSYDRMNFYRQIGEDPNQSYYEMALKHGFDLARFY